MPFLTDGLTVRYLDRWEPAIIALCSRSSVEGPGFQNLTSSATWTSTVFHSFPSSSQDFVIASHIIEHLANPLAMLVDIYRVLKPQGLLVLILPDRHATFDRERLPRASSSMWWTSTDAMSARSPTTTLLRRLSPNNTSMVTFATSRNRRRTNGRRDRLASPTLHSRGRVGHGRVREPYFSCSVNSEAPAGGSSRNHADRHSWKLSLTELGGSSPRRRVRSRRQAGHPHYSAGRRRIAGGCSCPFARGEGRARERSSPRPRRRGPRRGGPSRGSTQQRSDGDPGRRRSHHHGGDCCRGGAPDGATREIVAYEIREHDQVGDDDQSRGWPRPRRWVPSRSRRER